MRAKLREIKEELRRRMHQPIPEQGQWLRQVVTGFFAYHAVPTNSRGAGAFRYHVDRPLAARASAAQPEGSTSTWQRIEEAGRRLAPKAANPSSMAAQRFAVKHPRWEPYAGMPHVRICAGGAQ